MISTLLDHTGASPSLLFHALTYICLNLNHTANASIGNAIPMQILTGTIPAISALLQFNFNEPVYYRVEECHFPSTSYEKSDHFAEISEHVGMHLPS